MEDCSVCLVILYAFIVNHRRGFWKRSGCGMWFSTCTRFLHRAAWLCSAHSSLLTNIKEGRFVKEIFSRNREKRTRTQFRKWTLWNILMLGFKLSFKRFNHAIKHLLGPDRMTRPQMRQLFKLFDKGVEAIFSDCSNHLTYSYLSLLQTKMTPLKSMSLCRSFWK